MNDTSLPTERQHPQLEALPEWPTKTIAVLATTGDGPHAIPVSAPVRVDDRRIVLSLRRSRGSLARLRKQPQVALSILAEGDVAFTARGRARTLQQRLASAGDYAAIVIDVDYIDDHRQAEFVVESGIGRRWLDDEERRALGERVAALSDCAGNGHTPPPERGPTARDPLRVEAAATRCAAVGHVPGERGSGIRQTSPRRFECLEGE